MKFVTKSWIQTQFNNFAEKIASVFAKKSDIPTKFSQLNNDRGFINSINSLYNDGYVPRGFGVLNKVWGTDTSGNPGWRDYTPINSLSATMPGSSLDAVQGKILADSISYTEDLVNQLGSKLTDLEIYDFEIENPFINDTTYRVKENAWYPQNKIYKFGRVCWITLGVDTTNVTIPNRVLKVAELPDKFAPLSIISAGDPAGYSTGFYPGSNYIYISDRNTEKYPNWSNITIAEDFVRFNFVYISKI